MLDHSQKLRIRTHGGHSLHDHQFSSLLYGEAFLEDGLLTYFDGRLLTMCAYAVGQEELPQKQWMSKWVISWVRRTNPESVMLVTPRCPNLRGLSSLGYHRFQTWPAEPITRELIATCPGEAAASRVYRRQRHALNAPYRLQLSQGGDMDSRKMALIERFMRYTGMTNYLAALTTAWPAVLSNHDMYFVEAWREESLVGFIAFHRAFEQGAVAVAMARDPVERGVCDFLYAHMLDQAHHLGCTWINLCSSSTHGQHAFKLKWSEPSHFGAYALTEWRRTQTRRHFNLWGLRTLRLPAQR